MRSSQGRFVLSVLLLAGACGNESRSQSPIDPGASGAGGRPPAPTPTVTPPAGGSSSGSASCSAPVACPGTMSGPWCVERFPIDQQLQPTFTGVWSDRPDDVWISGWFTVAPASVTLTGMVFNWTGCAWVHGPLPSPLPALFGIWAAGANDVWAVGDNGTAINWDGNYWSNAPVGTDVRLDSISGTGPADIWTSRGFHWDGMRWLQSAGAADVADVWAVSPTDVWGTAIGANVEHFDGARWTTTQAGAHSAFAFFGIWGGPGVAWAVGEGDQIAHFSGGTWTQVQQPGGSFQGMLDVMQAGEDVYAVGQGVFHSVGGGPFVMDPDAPRVGYSGVWISDTQVWAVGTEGTVIHRARRPAP